MARDCRHSHVLRARLTQGHGGNPQKRMRLHVMRRPPCRRRSAADALSGDWTAPTHCDVQRSRCYRGRNPFLARVQPSCAADAPVQRIDRAWKLPGVNDAPAHRLPESRGAGRTTSRTTSVQSSQKVSRINRILCSCDCRDYAELQPLAALRCADCDVRHVLPCALMFDAGLTLARLSRDRCEAQRAPFRPPSERSFHAATQYLDRGDPPRRKSRAKWR